jgi:hypothetical protein
MWKADREETGQGPESQILLEAMPMEAAPPETSLQYVHHLRGSVQLNKQSQQDVLESV